MSSIPPAVIDVSLKDAFDVYQKQSDSLHKLWAYFQVVSLAVLGYTIGTDKSQWSIWTYVLVSLSYGFFAVASQYVVALSQHELNRFAKAVQDATKIAGPIGKQLSVEAVAVWRVRLFHSISALVVIGAIWGTWYDKCTGNKQCPTSTSSKPTA
jgi:hypothetical protein